MVARCLNDDCAEDLRALFLTLASPPPFRDDDTWHHDRNPFEEGGLVNASEVRTSPFETDHCSRIERELNAHAAALGFAFGLAVPVVQDSTILRRSSGLGHPS